MELPLASPQPIDQVIGSISRSNEHGPHSTDPRDITTDIQETLDVLVDGTEAGQPVMTLWNHGPHCGLSAGVGFLAEDPFYGRAFSDGPGIGLLVDDPIQVETNGSHEKPEPVTVVGSVSRSARGIYSLLNNFPDPLDKLKRDVRTVSIGETEIDDHLERVGGASRFAALMALKGAGVAAGCTLEDADRQVALADLYHKIARFGVFHSDGHAATTDAYSLVIAAQVLHPDEDELKGKPKQIAGEHLPGHYKAGLQRVLADTAIDWLADQTITTADVAPVFIRQTANTGL